MSKKMLYIGNLNYKIGESDLVGIFGKFGKVGKAKLIVDPKSKRSKGIAFVELYGAGNPEKAVKELDGKEIDGRIVKVSIAIESQPEKPKLTDKEKKSIEEKPLKHKKPKRKKGLDLLFANTSK